MRSDIHWKWRLDEVYVKINGALHCLWRAVDHEGEVLEFFASKNRDKAAPLTFMKRIMKHHGRAKAITTDGLRIDKAAIKELGNAGKQEAGRWANTRVENSHLPCRRRERAMLGFRQMKTLQGFSVVHAPVHNLLNQDRHLTGREHYKERRAHALREWRALAS